MPADGVDVNGDECTYPPHPTPGPAQLLASTSLPELPIPDALRLQTA
jgi:hypothetical protein